MEARGAGEAQSSEVWGPHIRFVDPSRSLYSYVTDEMFSQPVGKIKSKVIFLYICQLFLIGCGESQRGDFFPVFFFYWKKYPSNLAFVSAILSEDICGMGKIWMSALKSYRYVSIWAQTVLITVVSLVYLFIIEILLILKWVYLILTKLRTSLSLLNYERATAERQRGLHPCLVYLDQQILFRASVMFNHALSQYCVYIWNLVICYFHKLELQHGLNRYFRMIIFFFF